MNPATAFDVDTTELAASLRRLAIGIENDEVNVVRVSTAETASVDEDPTVINTLMVRYFGPPESIEKIEYKP